MQNRPTSPHLQVYRPQLTSMLSILHRMTGVILAMGLPVLVLWLVALASGPESFYGVSKILNFFLVKLMLFGWSFSLFFHLSNGLRHLFWDMGLGLDLETSYMTGYFVIVSAVLLTLLSWTLAWTLT